MFKRKVIIMDLLLWIPRTLLATPNHGIILGLSLIAFCGLWKIVTDYLIRSMHREPELHRNVEPFLKEGYRKK